MSSAGSARQRSALDTSSRTHDVAAAAAVEVAMAGAAGAPATTGGVRRGSMVQVRLTASRHCLYCGRACWAAAWPVQAWTRRVVAHLPPRWSDRSRNRHSSQPPCSGNLPSAHGTNPHSLELVPPQARRRGWVPIHPSVWPGCQLLRWPHSVTPVCALFPPHVRCRNRICCIRGALLGLPRARSVPRRTSARTIAGIQRHRRRMACTRL